MSASSTKTKLTPATVFASICNAYAQDKRQDAKQHTRLSFATFGLYGWYWYYNFIPVLGGMPGTAGGYLRWRAGTGALLQILVVGWASFNQQLALEGFVPLLLVVWLLFPMLRMRWRVVGLLNQVLPRSKEKLPVHPGYGLLLGTPYFVNCVYGAVDRAADNRDLSG